MIGDGAAFVCGVVGGEAQNAVAECGVDRTDRFAHHVAGGDRHRTFEFQFDLRFCLAEQKTAGRSLFKDRPLLIGEPDAGLGNVGDLEDQDGIRTPN